MTTPEITGLDFAVDVDFSEILTNPILDIAAHFWERERYEAFQVCYRSMRVIDDLVDNRKESGHQLTAHERNLFESMINDWVDSIRRGRPVDDFQATLLETQQRFGIPLWPWERLAGAMRYDLRHDGFPTFRSFLRYCEGAAIAPASVFMHLCGLGRTRGRVTPPAFDIRIEARPLALFSYLVHILRDFQKDTTNHHNYFPESLLTRFQLIRADLETAAQGGSISKGLRQLVNLYRGFAGHYRKKARCRLDELLPSMQPRYQLSLEVIYDLYLQIFERIKPDIGSFTTSELNPTADEVETRLDSLLQSFRAV